ncbi:hypothetical protein LCGC14_1742110 [marine sediment metagenome]|uniref:Diguanylate cyclase n=2 Tax=root TaxID=1 RepID=A0A831VRQ2_9FLAO|nr:diguanylate cyclase [Pricia antarctica]
MGKSKYSVQESQKYGRYQVSAKRFLVLSFLLCSFTQMQAMTKPISKITNVSLSDYNNGRSDKVEEGMKMDETVSNDSIYVVKKLSEKMKIDGDWKKNQWKEIESLRFKHHMGKSPKFRPKTWAKIAYDDTYLYVIFKVEDRYVVSTVEEFNGPVSEDSCVEFFFAPNADEPEGYFNIEINAGGTPLVHYQIHEERETKRRFSKQDFKTMKIAHSMPEVINPEITEPTTWIIEYKVPFTTLQKYASFKKPEPGDVWRANLYKTASSHSENRHYLTWSYVDYPKPHFHLPEFFGTLKFTD